ncbi:hypothetical protein ABPG74_007405 [Tetrahymena malaccensis]
MNSTENDGLGLNSSIRNYKNNSDISYEQNSTNLSKNQDSYKDSIKKILETMKTESDKQNKKYDENLRKIDQWRQEMKINFEISDDEMNDEDSYNFDFDPENQLRQSDLANQKYNQLIEEQIDKLLQSSIIDKELEIVKQKIHNVHSSSTFLESKKAFLKNKRKNLFKNYVKSVNQNNQIPEKIQNWQTGNNNLSTGASSTSSQVSSSSNVQTLEQIIKESMKLQSSKNSKLIEQQLMRLTQAIESPRHDDFIENHIFKKFKVTKDKLQTRTQQAIGYKPSDFRKIKRYRFNPQNMPFCGSNFDEAKKALVPQYHAVYNDQSDPFNRLLSKPIIPRIGVNKQQLQIKPKKNINDGNQPEHTTSPLKMKMLQNESYADWNEINLSTNNPQERDIQKKRKLEKLNKMSAEDREKYQRLLFKKAWQQVVRNVLKIYRFAQQARQDYEQNSRKFAILCSKEVRKKYGKSQRTQKDWALRSKKMHREMVSYWRKRERELNEIKRRKEKLEAELRRREEEEKESLLQKKRLEFLMKQSDLYAHFMAQKLGIAMNDKTNAALEAIPMPEVDQYDPLLFKGQKIDIDEGEAAFGVSALINDRRKELLQFDKETALERHQIGNEEDRIILTEQKKTTVQELQEAAKLDFSQVEPETQSSLVKPPEHFQGTLKEYQLKGLRWLDNLYEQGINGILADEMGLGKTIQAISLITHIAGTKNIWGPFLVIAPSSTLYNWQQELKKFFPALKVLPYWGSLKQRKMIRKYFSAKNLGMKSSPFHLVITSYQLVVSDEKTFQRIKWQYMILDEAQAIKNINSMRWKTLLSFNSRNKLLLTGTPIQNTMAELWALLHFIMPKLFDSHDQFQEWFSKDIEASSQDKSQLNQHQLQRLHAILKPFMLRRVKKDVEHELGAKKEFQIMCEMTKRQQKFYDHIKSKLSLKDFFKMFESKQKVDNLMNLVMQFRKVCNHPELFERRPCRSSFIFQNIYYYTGHLPAKMGEIKQVQSNISNPIFYHLPKLYYDEVMREETKNEFIHRKLGFLSAKNVREDLFSNKNSIFSFIRLLDLPINIMEIYSRTDNLYLHLVLAHALHTQQKMFKMVNAGGEKYECKNLWWSKNILHGQDDSKYDNYVQSFNLLRVNTTIDQIASLNSIQPYDGILLKQNNKFLQRWQKICQDAHNCLQPVKLYCIIKRAISPPINLICSSSSFQAYRFNMEESRIGRFIARANGAVFQKLPYSTEIQQAPTNGRSLIDLSVFKEGMLNFNNQESFSNIEVVDFASLVADSAKLKYLDALLTKLKREGHRVLIFCQMTRMIDILEDFMTRKKYKFFRLDGSCNISDRRDMVNEFQTSDKTFAFLLSTRAGGLGVTLTAADVVIFYDNDWNPTMDAQAMDRAHRIGQTKEVLVYRLVTKGTIEERILKRAQQKQMVQSTVYSGGAFKADIWKPQEVMELLLDESDMEKTQMFMPKRHKVTNGAGPKAEKKKPAGGAKDKKPKKEKKEENKDIEQIDEEEDEDEGMDVENENNEEEYGINFENIMEEGVQEQDNEEDEED